MKHPESRHLPDYFTKANALLAQAGIGDVIIQAVTPGMWCDADVIAMKDRITALEADLKLARDLVMTLTTRVQEWHAEADKWRALAEGAQHKAGSCEAPAGAEAQPEIPPIFRALRFSA